MITHRHLYVVVLLYLSYTLKQAHQAPFVPCACNMSHSHMNLFLVHALQQLPMTWTSKPKTYGTLLYH